ncbi:MAG: hypothetical protein HDR47_09025 [Bacteroides sp.]|nr:hypothetical protein [Bacteroides sp.]
MSRLLLMMFFFSCSVVGLGQKIAVNEVDAFTKAHKVQTSMEKLAQKRDFMGDITARIELAVRCVDGIVTIPCNISKTPIAKYDENSGLTLLFENGETATLSTMYTGVGGESKAMWGNNWFKTVLNVDEKDLDNLRNQKITDVRLSYFGSYQDFKLKGKERDLIKNMFTMVDKEMRK